MISKFLFIKILHIHLVFQPDKPAVQAATTTINKRTTDGSAGYPKRAKRPILDDVPMSSNGSSINSTNLASLSMDERDRLLQMLEQESSVRLYTIYIFLINNSLFF